jgi:sterol desaturase/sphingolipid hydroxylase (fatty acid hydroxylase superfamily)
MQEGTKMTDTSTSNKDDRFTRQWNYRPDVPINTSPLFQWPLNPIGVARWFGARWFVFGENLILVALASLIWFYFHPTLEQTETLEISWITKIYAGNFLLIAIVAGGLHFFFHSRKFQGNELKFDPREIVSKGRMFTLGSQLKDNMFWTLTSGVFFWTAFEVLMFWAMANGFAPILWWAENPVWLVAMFVLTPMWISFHFYWIHRLIHCPPLYKSVHSLHHRNTNIGPWSGLSMHPVEHLLYFSSILIHFIVASHPILILYHMQNQALTAATSLTGFDALLVKDKRTLELGNFHHQMHHRYFECNYGTLEVPWDKLFGSFHDGTSESHQKLLERRQKTMAKADQ